MDTPEITLAIFDLFNTLHVGAYLPEIVRVAIDDDGARAISLPPTPLGARPSSR
jgi:hypothetical protein